MREIQRLAVGFTAAAMAFWFTISAVLAGSAPTLDQIKAAKNIIIMISDGAGYNTHLATEYWHGSKQPYDSPRFFKYPVSTYILRHGGSNDTAPGNESQDPKLVYDAAKAWDDTPLPAGTDEDKDGYPDYFKGYQWLQATDPDSAGTMSAIVTGRKVYRGGINVDGYGRPLLTVPEAAKQKGKSVGSISTVRYNHATPAAGGGAHNVSRNNYIDIAYEMFGAGILDVMGGPGHPWFNRNGSKRNEPNLTGNRFDAALWAVISNGSGTASRTTVDGRAFTVKGADWVLVDDKHAIEDLASGKATIPKSKKLMMLPKVWGTLQYERNITRDWDGSGTIGNQDPSTGANLDLGAAPVNPGDDSAGDPMIASVPTLKHMTMAAVRHLDDNPNGFYLHVEGGACDWAMHGNSLARMIEEHTDFNNAVQAVIDYLDANTNGNNWENTLFIVTSDHDHNLYGPASDRIAFQDVTQAGKRRLPGHMWHDNNHGNQLVPAWVRGINADKLSQMIDGNDPVRGSYIDQVDLGNLMKQSLLDR
ncbi:MAG: alkaline phosphatase [Desulfosarcina sp.]